MSETKALDLDRLFGVTAPPWRPWMGSTIAGTAVKLLCVYSALDGVLLLWLRWFEYSWATAFVLLWANTMFAHVVERSRVLHLLWGRA